MSLVRGRGTRSGLQLYPGTRQRPALWCLVFAVGCLSATPSAAVEIEIGYAVAEPGDEVSFDVVLHTGGAEVAGIQNDIGFEPAAAIIAAPDGSPDCHVNPDIDKGETNFAFQPPGCLETETCTAVRALVLAFHNLDPIADGAVLYSCRVAIDADTPAAPHFLACSRAAAADPRGHRVATTCRRGEVLLPGGTPRSTPTQTPIPTQTPRPTPTPTSTPPVVEISIGYAVAQPGEEAAVDVVLHSGDLDVAGTQNDILFEPDAPIAARANGRPDCSVNPEIDKPSTSFAFQPPGCEPGSSCSAVRALVLSLENVEPIAHDALLYTCRVVVDEEGPAAPHFLACANEGASDPFGNALTTTCRSGEILLPGDSPRPTLTRTPTATPTATWTPPPTLDARTQGTPTGTRGPVYPTPESRSTRTPAALPLTPTPGLPDESAESGSDSGGCSVGGGASNAWLLLAPLLLLLARRVGRL